MRDFRNFGQFRYFKVNFGSENNFTFVTLNLSDQNFLKSTIDAWDIFAAFLMEVRVLTAFTE